MTTLDAESAVLKLQELLEQQSKLTIEKAEENRLKQLELSQQQEMIEIEKRRLAQEAEAEKRRDSRLNEVLQRLILSEQRGDHLLAKLVTTDDSYSDTVDQIVDTQKDLLFALYALLSRNKQDIASSAVTVRTRLELIQRQENLQNLQERAAKYGALNVPLNLTNEITEEERLILKLQEKLDDDF